MTTPKLQGDKREVYQVTIESSDGSIEYMTLHAGSQALAQREVLALGVSINEIKEIVKL